jgi:hypothetical protein
MLTLIWFQDPLSKKQKSSKLIKNDNFINWLVENHSSFSLVSVQKPGLSYLLGIKPDMELWAETKLEELSLVHNLCFKLLGPCSCDCHKGQELLESPLFY